MATTKSQKARAKKAAAKKTPTKVASKPIAKKSNRVNQSVGRPQWLVSVRFGKIYAAVSLAVLLLSTSVWATLGARLQQSNADQLVNAYLFENAHTFKEALLPGQHSFLLKWPLFWLVQIMGSTGGAIIGSTIGVSLLTVAAFAFLLYRIDRRPVVFGTLCLALASVLLLVPAQPYAGALLPVNMAMLATRNLEYILYIIGLLLLARWHEVKSWGFWLAVICLGVVIVSDRLFLPFSVGGALVALAAYVFTRRWKLAQLSVKWLLAGIFSATLATLAVWLITGFGLTHISSQSSAIYGLVKNVNGLLKGLFYAIFSLATNFGANPAYDAAILRNAPSLIAKRLFSIGGLSFIVNGLIMLFALLASAKLLISSLLPSVKHQFHEDRASSLSLMLLWSSIAAVGAFVVTNHYYLVDARYLTICLFALFVCLATYCRQKEWPRRRMVIIGGILLLSVCLGTIFTVQTYQKQEAALKETDDRNSLVAQALSHHPVKTLVGDYWRVIPTKQAAKSKLQVLPLSDCLKPRDTLSSKAWQTDLRNNSFAYLLSFDKSLTDYPSCTLDQIVTAYGRPNASAVIAGSLESPKEALLFYDKGTQSSPTINATNRPPATVVPIPLDELPNVSCNSLTVMNVVAHEDDDLLFMNPDLMHDIKAGRCVRTVYITAGDAGGDEFYWLSREQGSQAAYAQMIGTPNVLWVQRVVKIGENAYVTIANPKDNPRVSLVYLRLPDGNVKGQGFSKSSHESLNQLSSGSIKSMNSVTKQSDYNAQKLIDSLTSLMTVYDPGEIRTQSDFAGSQFPDHSDHRAVGRFTQEAYKQYEAKHYENKVKIPLKFYMGYPIHEKPQNVTNTDLEEKVAAFLAYATYDRGVCQDVLQCSKNAAYDAYLKRQYQHSY